MFLVYSELINYDHLDTENIYIYIFYHPFIKYLEAK